MATFGKADVNVGSATKDKAGQDLPVLGQPPKWSPNAGAYKDMIVKAALKHGVPPDLAIRQAAKESGFDPAVISVKRKSPAGAMGMFQFMPDTAKAYGVNVADPADSADKAMLYMSKLYKQFGDWKLASWAYNWGQGNLRKYLRGEISKKTGLPIQLPRETRHYGLIVADGWTPVAAAKTPPSVK